jgi:hypothetical protein
MQAAGDATWSGVSVSVPVDKSDSVGVVKACGVWPVLARNPTPNTCKRVVTSHYFIGTYDEDCCWVGTQQTPNRSLPLEPRRSKCWVTVGWLPNTIRRRKPLYFNALRRYSRMCWVLGKVDTMRRLRHRPPEGLGPQPTGREDGVQAANSSTHFLPFQRQHFGEDDTRCSSS